MTDITRVCVCVCGRGGMTWTSQPERLSTAAAR